MRRRRSTPWLDSLLSSVQSITQGFLTPLPYIGIDLGTYQTRIWVPGRGITLREHTMVVKQTKGAHEFTAIGNEAYQMLGKTPPEMQVYSPLERGRVSDFDALVYFLDRCTQRALSTGQGNYKQFNALISVPIGLTEVEEMALLEVGKKVGGRQVQLVEAPVALGFGLRMPVLENVGSAIVDMGGGTTEISLLSLGGIVLSKVLPIGGHDANEAIQNYLRIRYGLLVGEKTAEEVKHTLGSIINQQDFVIEVNGRSIENGMPKTIKVRNHLFYESLYPLFGQIIDALRDMVEETPPELIGDITKKGIVLTGMGSKFIDLDKYIQHELGVHVASSDEPADRLVKGLGWLIEHPDIMRRIAIRLP